MVEDSRAETTLLLQRARSGERAAFDELFSKLYGELRLVAGNLFKREAKEYTLQPTAVVHEVYSRLVGAPRLQCEDHRHFICVASRAMRQVLVDHARECGVQKPGGERVRLALQEDSALAGAPDVDVLDLNTALDELESLDATKARIVELRFFAGQTLQQISEVLELSNSTVKDGWYFTLAWLRRELEAQPEL